MIAPGAGSLLIVGASTAAPTRTGHRKWWAVMRGLVDGVVGECRTVFEAKFGQYGVSWRCLRVTALADRIFTKAARIRRLESLDGVGRVDDSIESEYVGIVNYAVLLLDRLAHEGTAVPDLGAPIAARWADPERALKSYDQVMARAIELMSDKNHDYGDAWRHLLPSTFTDEVITRTLRFRELVQQGEPALGRAEDQIVDTLNYSLLALLRLRAEEPRGPA